MSQPKESRRSGVAAAHDSGAASAGPTGAASEREGRLTRIVAAHERLMALLAASHTPDFLEVGVTMSQAKALYLVAVADEIHMSALPGLLGVSLSTVSGVVDRLVDHGLLDRREDPMDRRSVIVRLTPAGREAVDRFRDVGKRQLIDLLRRVDPPGLSIVESAYGLLLDAAGAIGIPDPSADGVDATLDQRKDNE